MKDFNPPTENMVSIMAMNIKCLELIRLIGVMEQEWSNHPDTIQVCLPPEVIDSVNHVIAASKK